MSGALQAAAGIYPSLCFAPTRLNTADDPTRLQAIREAYKSSIVDRLPAEALHLLHFHRFARFAAGWIRLTILLSFPRLTGAFACHPSCSAWNALGATFPFDTSSALIALLTLVGDTLSSSAWLPCLCLWSCPRLLCLLCWFLLVCCVSSKVPPTTRPPRCFSFCSCCPGRSDGTTDWG